jgi:hypothetical protein
LHACWILSRNMEFQSQKEVAFDREMTSPLSKQGTLHAEAESGNIGSVSHHACHISFPLEPAQMRLRPPHSEVCGILSYLLESEAFGLCLTSIVTLEHVCNTTLQADCQPWPGPMLCIYMYICASILAMPCVP